MSEDMGASATPKPALVNEASQASLRPSGFDPARGDFAPCPLCKQYSHSLGKDQLADAFLHFQSMIAHPVRGHPMGHSFDEKTRDVAQVLMAAARRSTSELQCEPMEPDEEGWSEWIHPLPGYLMQCCDCGLIHEMEFVIGTSTDKGPLNEGETREALILFRAKRHQDT